MTSRFSEADLQRWADQGIITAAQRNAILADLQTRGASERGLTLTTLLYYAGGLLVLLAYSIFLGVQWEEMDQGARVAIAGASLVFFTAVAHVLLRNERFRLPGELLQVAAVAIVPLLTFAVLDSAGLWPDDPGYRFGDSARRDYQTDLTWGRMALGGATLMAAIAAFYLSRSPFVLVAAIVSFASLAVDVSLQPRQPDFEYDWGIGQALVVAGLGACVLGAGVALRGRTERDYSFWLYISGLAGLTVGLAFLTFPDNAGNGWGALWMFVALVVLGLSIWLQERLLAVAGLAAGLAYPAKLALDVFTDARAALVFVALGVLLVGLGMLYQRYGDRLFARPAT